MASVTVVDARFVAGATTFEVLPPGTAPEFAFIGRSNVGKSSLMNMLLQRKGLVRTSRTPGQTRQVNLFAAELQRRRGRSPVVLADLPGYGYSTASSKEEQRMSELLGRYLFEREHLRVILQLVDTRHPVTKTDKQTAEALREATAARVVVGTKIDLVTPGSRPGKRKELAEALGVSPGDVFLVSSAEKMGRDELWQRLLQHLAPGEGDVERDGDSAGDADQKT
jgi:GTP-binding protein